MLRPIEVADPEPNRAPAVRWREREKVIVQRANVLGLALVGLFLGAACANETGGEPPAGFGGSSAVGGVSGSSGSGTAGTPAAEPGGSRAPLARRGPREPRAPRARRGRIGSFRRIRRFGCGGCGGSAQHAAWLHEPGTADGCAARPQGATALTPPAPTGWSWYPVEGTVCRDGSPNGLFVRFTTSDKLLIYLEGGGACSNLGFCNFNPQSVN